MAGKNLKKKIQKYLIHYYKLTYEGETLTQKSEAQKGNITPEMEAVAHDENINVNKLAKLIADGRVVIPEKHQRPFKSLRNW